MIATVLIIRRSLSSQKSPSAAELEMSDNDIFMFGQECQSLRYRLGRLENRISIPPRENSCGLHGLWGQPSLYPACTPGTLPSAVGRKGRKAV